MRMKKILSLSFIALLVIAACKKDDTPQTIPNPTPAPVVDSNAMQYVINGLTDVSLGWSEEKMIPLSFAYVKGNQEMISVSINGLPAGVTAEFDVAKGTPSFATILKLKTNVSKDGNYPLQVVCKTDKDSVKKFDFNLKVLTTDCRDYAAGLMACTNQCSSTQGDVLVEKGDVNSWQVNVKNLVVQNTGGTKLVFSSLPFKVNCDNKTLELPYTSYVDKNNNFHLLSGNGTYTNETNTITISYHDGATGVVTNTCKYDMSRK